MKPLGKLNIAIAAALVVLAVVLFLVLRPRTGTPYAPGSRRWVPPTFIAVGLFGVAWLIVYYVAGTAVPFMSALGNWNILIGMAGMAAAFIIATLWK
ncbi:cell division protein CrgA [Microlunatus elymi]|uniref:Cell division protein CrgA n=1 Tax=Microlunatus elymi TaxID=2596828 RepID=A0A516Q512_9ACTN|nr:cell division protein CrgA [Microlunatus elymi]